MSKFRAIALGAAFASVLSLAVAAPDNHGIDLAGIDHLVVPGDDFFNYANGTWIKATPIPADRASYGPDEVLTDKTRTQVQTLIQDAAKDNAAPGSVAQKVGDYYASYMDEAGIEAKGVAPLKADLARVAAIKDRQTLSSYLGTTLRADVDALNSTNFYTDHVFGVWITQGFEDPGRNVPYLLQGGLGMPDRDYYLRAVAQRWRRVRAKYQAHIAAYAQTRRCG